MARILGIAGGTASGKTTLSRALKKHLGDTVALLTHDQYYRPVPPEVDPASVNFDHPSSLETERMVEDLLKLRSGAPVRIPEYDFSRHARHHEDVWTVVEPAEVVLVEGILVFSHEQLRTLMDDKIFVHAPDDIRLIRRIRRDVRERGRGVDDILAQYERTVRPMHERFVVPSSAHADLTVDGTQPIEQMLDNVLQHLGL